jgi:poly(3-hydroxybutyrate) depolymerase
MLALAILVCFALCPPPQHAPGGNAAGANGKSAHPASSAESRSRPVPVVLEGGRPGARALLIALHGGSFSDAEPVHLAERCRDELSAAANAEGLRLLVPLAPVAEAPGASASQAAGAGTPSGGAPAQDAFQVPWSSSAGESRVLALVDAELKAHRADSARIYLAGHGAGATGALILAARHPARFAAVAAWAGTPPPLWDHDKHVIGIAGDPVPALAATPLFLWSARDDPWLDRATWALFVRDLAAQRVAQRAESAGSPAGPRATPFVLVEEDTGGHGYGAKGPAPGLHFLSTQRRPQPP